MTPAARRLAPLWLAAAGLGAYVMIERDRPREHDVVLDLGDAAPEVSRLELSWRRPSAEDLGVETRLFFARGAAKRRVHATVRLPPGGWDVEVTIERFDRADRARWAGRVELPRTPPWNRDNLDARQVILPVHEALR